MDDQLRVRLRQELVSIVRRLDEPVSAEDEKQITGLLCGCFIAMIRSTCGSEGNALELIRRAWPGEDPIA